jgi:hypothetical protein
MLSFRFLAGRMACVRTMRRLLLSAAYSGPSARFLWAIGEALFVSFWLIVHRSRRKAPWQIVLEADVPIFVARARAESSAGSRPAQGTLSRWIAERQTAPVRDVRGPFPAVAGRQYRKFRKCFKIKEAQNVGA